MPSVVADTSFPSGIPVWRGLPDPGLVRQAVRTRRLQAVAGAVGVAGLFYLTGIREWWWLPVILWLLWLIRVREWVGQKSRYLGAEYIIDEHGVRAVNRSQRLYWGPVPEQAESVRVEIQDGYAHVRWGVPVAIHRGKSQQLSYRWVPEEGLLYVTDVEPMMRALEAWQERMKKSA